MLGFQFAVRSIPVPDVTRSVWKVTVADGGVAKVKDVEWLSTSVSSDKWISWGDGSVDEITSEGTHTYSTAGTYTVTLSEDATQFRVGYSYDISSGTLIDSDITNDTVTDFVSWGSHITNVDCTFANCNNLDVTGLPAWPSEIEQAWYTFACCTSLHVAELPAWPNGLISAGNTYFDCTSLNVAELPAWPDGLTYANGTYKNCSSLAVAKLPEWSHLSSVIAVDGTYEQCPNIKAPVLGWPINVTSCKSTYKNSGVTGQIKEWGSKITDVTDTYYGCTGLTGAWIDDAESDEDILMPSHISTHSNTVTNSSDAVRRLFFSSWGGRRYTSTKWQITIDDLDEYSVSGVEWLSTATEEDKYIYWGDGTKTAISDAGKAAHTYEMAGTYTVTLGGHGRHFVAKGGETEEDSMVTGIIRFGEYVTSLSYSFYGCKNLVGTTLPSWPTRKFKDLSHAFHGCTSLALTTIGDWPLTLTDITSAFQGCSQLALSSIPDFTNCTSLTSTMNAFYGCSRINASIPIWPSNGKLTNMAWMFYGCANLTATSIPAWPSTATSIEHAFDGCEKLAATSIPEWPEGVTNLEGVYSNCALLTATGGLPEWKSGITSVAYVYNGCASLAVATLPEWSSCASLTTIESAYSGAGITAPVVAWPSNLVTASRAYSGTSVTGAIPQWPSTLESADETFKDCTSLTGAWTDDEEALMPSTVTAHTNTVTGASDAVRGLFYAEWGGNRSKDPYAPNTAFEVSFAAQTTMYLRMNFLSVGATCTVIWGDGTWSTVTHTGTITANIFVSHTFAAGTYIVQLSDILSQFNFVASAQSSTLLSPNTYVTKALRWGDSFTRAHSVYYRATNLIGKIPKWGSSLKSVESCYSYCTALEGAWTDDANELMPTSITSKTNCFVGASSAIRALFTSAWGGTKA